MTSTEAIIYQLKRLKGKPLKQKIVHIATYFWQPIIIFLVIAIVFGYYIAHLVTARDTALSVICLNSYSDSDTINQFIRDFAADKGIDLEESDVQISTNLTMNDTDLEASYNTSQILVSNIVAHSVDLLVGDLDATLRYFYQDVFLNLNQVLTEEQKTQYSDYFLYVDMAAVRHSQDELGLSYQYPNPRKPDEMEEPVPVALWLPSENNFSTIFYPHEKDGIVVGIISTSENLVNAQFFLDFIM